MVNNEKIINQFLSKTSDSDLDCLLHEILGRKDYKILYRISRLFYFNTPVEYVRVGVKDGEIIQSNPNNLYKSELYRRHSILRKEIRDANFLNLFPLFKLAYLHILLLSSNRIKTKFFTEFVYNRSSLLSGEEYIRGEERIITYLKGIGKRISKKDVEWIQTAKELQRLRPPAYDSYPLFDVLDNKLQSVENIFEQLKARGIVTKSFNYRDIFDSGYIPDSEFSDFIWYHGVSSLVYLFLLLIDYKIIESHELHSLDCKLKVFVIDEKFVDPKTVVKNKSRLVRRHAKDFLKTQGRPLVFKDIHLIVKTEAENTSKPNLVVH